MVDPHPMILAESSFGAARLTLKEVNSYFFDDQWLIHHPEDVSPLFIS
jgi:hypothetical protein